MDPNLNTSTFFFVFLQGKQRRVNDVPSGGDGDTLTPANIEATHCLIKREDSRARDLHF